MPFRFKKFFAVVPNLLLLYKHIAYKLSDNYSHWLHCYINSGYPFVWLFDSLWSALWCSLRTWPWSPLIHLLPSFAILLSTQNIFVCRHYQNSISSATDSMLPQSDIDCIGSWCADDYETYYW